MNCTCKRQSISVPEAILIFIDLAGVTKYARLIILNALNPPSAAGSVQSIFSTSNETRTASSWN